MTQYGRDHFYDKSSNPCPIKACKSWLFAYLFDNYDNDLKQNILCTGVKNNKSNIFLIGNWKIGNIKVILMKQTKDIKVIW